MFYRYFWSSSLPVLCSRQRAGRETGPMNAMTSTTATLIFTPKASTKRPKRLQANWLRPFRRFCRSKHISSCNLILKPGRKRISVCLPEPTHFSDE